MLNKFRIGNYESNEIGTGVTVIISEEGAVGGVSVRGAAPATRETDLLKSENAVDKVNAVFLSGGSAFGLDVASGIMKYLKELNVGFGTTACRVPIVCGACIYDLEYLTDQTPTSEFGYNACVNAEEDNFKTGNIGCGCGATVGKVLGMKCADKSGLGVAYATYGELEIAVITCVNAVGDVFDYKTGERIKGINADGKTTLDIIKMGLAMNAHKNTTIACVLTNAKLTKSQANKLADIAHDGYAMTIRPVHTMVDGDAIFTLASSEIGCDFMMLSAIVPQLVADSVISAVGN